MHYQLTQQDAQRHVGGDQPAAVEAVFWRLLPVSLDLADHGLDRIFQQAEQLTDGSLSQRLDLLRVQCRKVSRGLG